MLTFLPSSSGQPEPPSPAQRASNIPTISSIYSQPTPDLRRQDGRYSLAPTALSIPYEVSPPSSPETGPGPHTEDWGRNISPVEESSGHDGEYTNNTSVYRDVRELMKHEVAGGFDGVDNQSASNLAPSERDSIATRWTDFMRPGSSRGGDTNPYGLRRPPVEPMPLRTGPDGLFSGGQPGGIGLSTIQPLVLRRGQDGGRRNSPDTDKIDGASNQHSTARPITDKPLPATDPLPLPLKSKKRLSNKAAPSGSSTPLSSRGLTWFGKSTVLSAEDDIKPTVPLKAGRNSPSTSSFSSTPLHRDPSNYYNSYRHDSPSPAYSSPNTMARSPYSDRRSLDDQTVDSNSRTSTPTAERSFNAAMREHNVHNWPVSRFSATTYATETTLVSAPGTPVFNTGSETSSPSLPSSVLGRGRPVSAATSVNSKSTARKPLPSESYPTPPSSVLRSSTAKLLPPSPAEAQSADLTSSLQAQLDNLRHQRRNLQKIIDDLSRLIVPGPNAGNIFVREDAKRTVDECKREMDEIRQQEHEVGLRLHRAWRRRDKEGNITEPTGLWVRRVTG